MDIAMLRRGFKAVCQATENRFQNYQASAGTIKDLTEVHANVYKLMGMIAANYDKAKTDSFSNEQLNKLDK